MGKKTAKIIPSIIMYILAGLIGIYAIWAYIFCADIVAQARAAGQLATSGNSYDIASFYMESSGRYFIFAFISAAIGILLHKNTTVQIETTAIPAVANDADDDELDEWFDGE
jgi:amino acid transporter